MQLTTQLCTSPPHVRIQPNNAAYNAAHDAALHPTLTCQGPSPLPLLKELRVREGGGHDPCSLRRGIGPSDSHNLLHLGKDPQDAVRFFSNHGQIPHSLI